METLDHQENQSDKQTQKQEKLTSHKLSLFQAPR